MSTLNLPANPTLKDFQAYAEAMRIERGFTTDLLMELVLLGEEVGELFKAVRKNTKGMSIDPNSQVGPIADELADVFIYLCCIANFAGVDLETAFRAKEEMNKKRQWHAI